MTLLLVLQRYCTRSEEVARYPPRSMCFMYNENRVTAMIVIEELLSGQFFPNGTPMVSPRPLRSRCSNTSEWIRLRSNSEQQRSLLGLPKSLLQRPHSSSTSVGTWLQCRKRERASRKTPGFIVKYTRMPFCLAMLSIQRSLMSFGPRQRSERVNGFQFVCVSKASSSQLLRGLSCSFALSSS